MRLSCLLVFCCSLLLFSCGEQEQAKLPELPAADVVKNLKRDAVARATALRKGDYEAVVRYTPKKLARIAGGTEGIRASTEKAMIDKEGKPMKWLEAEIGKPGPIKKDGDRLLAWVPQKNVYRVTGGRVLGERTVLAVSENGGRDWVFIDEVKVRNESFFNKTFPELAGKMKLPPKGESRFEKDAESLVDELTAEEMTDNLKRDATACAKALTEGDYEGMIRYMPAKLAAMVGGSKGIRKTIELAMEKGGWTIIGATVGDAGPVTKDGDRLLSLVPQYMRAQIPAGRIKGTGWLLGISDNGGRDWVFVDTAKMKEASFGKVFPELMGKIELPEPEAPRLEED